jgi:hypothetical protein
MPDKTNIFIGKFFPQKRLYRTVLDIFQYQYRAYDCLGKFFTDTADCITYSIGHIPIPIMSLRLYMQIFTDTSDFIVDTEDFESLKRYFYIKSIF